MIAIRPASRTDVGIVSEVTHRAYSRYVGRMAKKPEPMIADYSRLILNGGVWLAEQHKDVVGLLILETDLDCLLVSSLAVTPEAQGKGIGSKLLQFAELQAYKRNFAQVRLYTNIIMVENIEFYRNRGFVESHRATEFGYSRVYFTKYLEPLRAT